MLSRLLFRFEFEKLSLACLFLVPCCYVFGTYGVQVIHLDFASPEFAGTIYGIGNTFGTLGGALRCRIE